MNGKTLIYKLIYQAFLDIRSAVQSGDKNANIIAYKLSDVFHNVPLQLIRFENEDGGYEKVLIDIREREKRAKCEDWLDNVIRQL